MSFYHDKRSPLRIGVLPVSLSALLLIAPYHSTARCSSMLHCRTTYSCPLKVTALERRGHPKLSKHIAESDELCTSVGIRWGRHQQQVLRHQQHQGSTSGSIKLYNNDFLNSDRPLCWQSKLWPVFACIWVVEHWSRTLPGEPELH